MDDKTQKERLEQELRFLKESFEAEVISNDEFEKGKDRIEKKLKEFEIHAEMQNDETTKQNIQKPPLKEEPIAKEEGEKLRLKGIQEKVEGHENFKPLQTQASTAGESKQTKAEEPKAHNQFKYGVVFIVLLILAFVSYSFLKDKSTQEINEKANEIKFVPACSSNFDCRQEGKEGFCLNSGTKDAKCVFTDLPKINVIVINDKKNCFNCDTKRILSILESWFGVLNVKEIDYDSDDSRLLAEKFGAKLLPFYILDENITKKQTFEQFKQAFIKRDNSYVLNDITAGSTFYMKRENINNKLDLFVKAGDTASIKAENNLREFLDVFKEVKFEMHLSNDNLTQDLNLKTFPTFLINNRIKFSGVLTADTIKNNFCEMNKLPECEKSLSKNLV